MLSFIISKNVLQEMIETDKGNLIIIDLREKEEYEIYHIEGAINYNYDLLMKSYRIEENISRDKKIIVYCERGGRSIYVTRKLRAMGYNVASLMGGLENYLEN